MTVIEDSRATRSLLRITLFAVAAFTISVSRAAQPSESPQQQEFLASQSHQDEAKVILDKLTEHFFHGCTDIKDTGTHVVVFKPFVFDAKGAPTAGFWKDQHSVSGCGINRLLNVYFQALPTGDVQALAGLNGSTIASLVQQRDAVRYAFLGAAKRYPLCKEFIVSDTRFDKDLPIPKPSAPPTPSIKRAWRETWAVSGCRLTALVPLQFIEAENGTVIVPDSSSGADRKP